MCSNYESPKEKQVFLLPASKREKKDAEGDNQYTLLHFSLGEPWGKTEKEAKTTLR
jgi:hypothetical protein